MRNPTCSYFQIGTIPLNDSYPYKRHKRPLKCFWRSDKAIIPTRTQNLEEENSKDLSPSTTPFGKRRFGKIGINDTNSDCFVNRKMRL